MKAIISFFLISLILSACGGQTISDSTPTPSSPASQTNSLPATQSGTAKTPPDLYAGFTQNPTIPFIMVHQSGETLGVIQEIDTSNITGVVWVSSEGKSIVVHSDGNGMPKSALVGEDIVFYTNYTSDTVDITILHTDGTRETFQAKLDTDLLNRITAFFAPPVTMISYSNLGSHPLLQYDSWTLIRTGLYMTGAAFCIGNVIASFAEPVALLLLAKACSGFILGTMIRVGSALNLNVADLQTIKDISDILKCSPVDPLSCINAMATELEKLVNNAASIDSKTSLFPTRTPLGQGPGVGNTPTGSLGCNVPIPLGVCLDNHGNRGPCGFKPDPVTGRQPTGNQVCQSSGKTCLYVSRDGGVECSP
jgi:hypothetical protein